MVQKIKPKLLKLNKKINWYPEFLKEGRVKHNLETAPDWNISRNRYWASAIPIWKCESCDEMKVIGSVKDLEKEAVDMKGKIDLHKDFLDKIHLKCKCGKKMSRIPEVMDCWFESGSMPFAQFHYPFENKKFFEDNFPSQFVAEYIGQTRAWFYYMIVLSAILFEDIPFENVLTTGTILSEDGSKMSKSKNNYPDPWILFEKYGVDALRFYLLASPVMSADNLNFSEKGVDEVYKKVLLLLYNTNKFYELYKSDDKISEPKSKNLLDRWIISRLNELVRNFTKHFEEYNTVKACQEIRLFVDDLSTWYVRRSRDRFNSGDRGAGETLGFVLENLSKVCAPVLPFVSEKIYQTINGEKDSVHLQEWPKFSEKKIDKKIIGNMNKVREVVSLALKERDILKIALKQPLSKLDVKGVDLEEEYLKIIAEEVNVKKVVLKKGKEVVVELDTKMTPELEMEGYAREISRSVQALRKKAGLVKEDKINLVVEVNEELLNGLKKMENLVAERTNSGKIIISSYSTGESSEKFKNKSDFDVKGKKVVIKFNKI